MGKKPAIKIELWGTYPPPFGGVTIHIKRLFAYLKEQKEFVCSVANFNGTVDDPKEHIVKIKHPVFVFLKLPFQKRRLIHFHSRQILGWALLRLLGFRHLKIITLHNQILRKLEGNFKRKLATFGLNGFDRILLNDQDYGEFLNSTFKVPKEKMRFVPAFIPPLKSEYRGVPQEILNFRKKKTFVISANAWMLVRIGGKDLYGAATLIDLVKRLKDDGMDVGLVFVLPQIGDEEYFSIIQQKIDQDKLKEEILIFNRPIPNAFEVWGISDLFVRPTMMDIEGISIKESLMMGTPVVASDVCARPVQCHIYPYGDLDKLVTLSEQILVNRERVTDFEESSAEQIVNEYKSLLTGK